MGMGYRSGQGRVLLWVGAIVLAVIVGAGLVWLGYTWGRGGTVAPPPATETPTLQPPPTVAIVLLPTDTPLPTATSLPTATQLPSPVPATDVPVQPRVVVGEKGANVRSGPGANFDKVGYLDPGAEAKVIGRYADWWQIEYGGAPAWIYGDIVTALEVEDVAEVQPPPSPTSPPVVATTAPTQPPPTIAPADYRGLVPDDFQVEGAPGPYKAGSPIWFNFWITNKSSDTVEFKSLGVVVEETGQYQQSYSYSEILAGVQFNHRDHIIIETPGTYSLWLTIGFYDDAWFRIMGPVTVVVE